MTATTTATATDPALGADYRWESDTLDLAAYLERISYSGPLTPDLETLRALNRAHAAAIPFENLDIMLGGTVGIDIAGLQDKLVRSRRGGYCHEQNTLFATVLDRLGFHVTGLSARMLFGSAPETLRPVGHTILRVEVDGADWIVDVGVGGRGPLEPVRIADGTETRQGGWTYRLDRGTNGWWLLRLREPGGWFTLYNFSLERYYRADFADHNYIAATHPRSPFTRMVVAQRNGPDIRYVLADRTLTTTRADAEPEARELDPEELPSVLRSVFDLHLEAWQERELVRVVAAAPGGQELTGG